MESQTKNEVSARVLFIGNCGELSKPIEESLTASHCVSEYAAGNADALRRLRRGAYDVVITNPTTSIEEDLALLDEIRAIRPGVRSILLAPHGTPEDVIAALRAHVFVCLTPPFSPREIAEYAFRAGTEPYCLGGIEVLSAQRDWVSLRADCRMLTAERVLSFFKELRSDLPDSPRETLMIAFREILMNAVEHGAEFDSEKIMEIAAVHTARAIVFYVHDPGSGFRQDDIPHAAVANPSDPTAHLATRAEQGLRPGGYGILLARGLVDELLYSEIGNEALLIKYLA
jgi:anti-sigma regulatory factor (Ser/Thr protein kinase)